MVSAHIFTRVHRCVLWLGNISLIGLPVSAVWDGDPVNHICLWHLLASLRIYEPLLRPVLFSLALVQHQPLLPTLVFPRAPSSRMREHVWGNREAKLEPAIHSPSNRHQEMSEVWCDTSGQAHFGAVTVFTRQNSRFRTGVMSKIWPFVFLWSFRPIFKIRELWCCVSKTLGLLWTDTVFTKACCLTHEPQALLSYNSVPFDNTLIVAIVSPSSLSVCSNK